MFPEVFRDEVFRLGTPRLWLRWPRVEDVPAIEAFAGRREVATMTGTWVHPLPDGFVLDRIAKIRATNPTGTGLSYAMTLAAAPTHVIGLIGGSHEAQTNDLAFGYMLSPQYWGQGLMPEAVRALVDMVFLVSETAVMKAGSFVHNPASRRVLEKSGFAPLGIHPYEAPARGGQVDAHLFALTRAVWRASREVRRGGADATALVA